MRRRNEKTPEEYKEKFRRILEDTEVVYSADWEEKLIIDENEEWVQCYNADDEIRKNFPRYWFLSDRGHLLSVGYSQNGIKLVKAVPNDKNSEYRVYIYTYEDENGKIRQKKIKAHHLVKIIFGGLAYGNAEKKLKEDGLQGFGIQEDSLNCHHINNNRSDNRAENLELLTKKVHSVMNATPSQKKADKKNFSYMKRLSDVVADEEPNRITMYVDSINIIDALNKFYYDASKGYKSIHALDEITLSQNAIKETETLRVKLADKMMIKAIADELLKQRGQEYFDDKAFFTDNNLFFKITYNQKLDTIDIEEITNVVELSNRHLVKCCIDNDRYQIVEL